MKNRIAQQVQRDVQERFNRQAEGLHSSLLAFTSQRSANLQISDLSKLPQVINDATLQDVDGLFYFMPGYSILDGPDILA